MPGLPVGMDRGLLTAIPRMTPWANGHATQRWILREAGRQYLVYLGPAAEPELDLSSENGSWNARVVDFETGQLPAEGKTLVPTRATRLPINPNSPTVVWLTRMP